MNRIETMYVNGKWVESNSGQQIEVVNPADSKIMYRIPKGEKEDINQAVDAARVAFESEEWQAFKPHERGKVLYDVAHSIREEKENIAKMETLDTGKPISQGRSDVEAAARYFEYYAGVADKILGETIPIEPGILDFTVREPVGVTGHVIPWNYPIQIMARSTGAAIATGNAVVVKPAEDTPATALKLAELFSKTKLPNGILNVVTGYGHEAGSALSDHPDVDHITFTGSVETGTAVMQSASRHVTPVTMELGGKSPNIVFEDCDQNDALNWVVRSIIQNAGQTCSAGSRLLVQAEIYDEFVEKVCQRLSSLVIAPGMSDPDIGPILSKKQFSQIDEYMKLAKQEARILTGGEKKIVTESEGGFYFKPTVLDNLHPDSRLAQEEIFGPILTVFAFNDEQEALKLANSTSYGLVTGIWTKDISRAHRLAEKVRSGQVFINNYGAGGGIQMPFGGSKKSGFGREKGLEALRNYTQVKNVAVKMY